VLKHQFFKKSLKSSSGQTFHYLLLLTPRAPYAVRVSAFFPLDTIPEMDYDDIARAIEP
jgi:hypothetical protein